jgi:hypothetical protein
MSVLVHGMTSYAGSQRYADWYEAQDHTKVAEAKPVHHDLRPRLRQMAGTATAAPVASSASDDP